MDNEQISECLRCQQTSEMYFCRVLFGFYYLETKTYY